MTRRQRMNVGAGLWVTVMALGLGGCWTPTRGITTEGDYEHEDLRYRVTKPAGAAHVGALAGPDWRLANFTLDDSGRPTDLQDGSRRWTYRLKLDVDDDGTIDLKSRSALRYDLYFEHLREDASLSVRALPVSRATGAKSLQTLAQRYLNSLTGSLFVADFSAGAMSASTATYASRPLEGAAFEVAGREAYRLDIEVANLEQLRLDPEAQRTRLRVVLVRPNFNWMTFGKYIVLSDPRPPALMLIALIAPADTFASHLPALDTVLSHIVFP